MQNQMITRLAGVTPDSLWTCGLHSQLVRFRTMRFSFGFAHVKNDIKAGSSFLIRPVLCHSIRCRLAQVISDKELANDINLTVSSALHHSQCHFLFAPRRQHPVFPFRSDILPTIVERTISFKFLKLLSFSYLSWTPKPPLNLHL